MTADPKSVLSHGLAPEVGTGGGYALLDPKDVAIGVDRGDGVMGTLIPAPEPPPLDSLTGLDLAVAEGLNLIYDQRGKLIVIRSITPGEHSPSTGRRTPQETAISVTALISEYGADEIARAEGLLVTGDIRVRVRVSASLQSLKPGDFIDYLGESYRVKTATPKPLPSGAVYEYQATAQR